nr:tetratricopeptide repeat protein [Melioribacteraceae bacterium]
MSAKFYSIIRNIIISSLLTTVTVLAISFQDTSNQLNLFPNIIGNAKIDSLNSYASRLKNSDSDLRMQIGQQCYSLSKSNDYKLGIVQSLKNISKSYKLQEKTDSAIITGKKALTFIDNNENLELSAELNSSIAGLYTSYFQFDSAYTYYNIAVGKAIKLKDSTSVPNLLHSSGLIRWRQGKFNKAIQLYKTSLRYNEKLGVDSLTVKSLNNIGAAYYHLGNKELALEYYINASEVRRRYNSSGSPVIDNNIGLVYLDLNDTLMAFNYFESALDIAKKTNHTLGEGYSYLNFGDLYFKKKKYSMAIEYYNKSKLHYEKLNDINANAKILNKIGQVYFETNQTKLAETKFLGAYKKSKVNGLKLTQTESLINLCRIQILHGKNEKKLSNSDDTRKKLDLAFELAREGDFVNSTLKIFLLNSQFYETLKDYKNSLKYHQNYNNLKDSLFNEQRIRIVSNTKSKYDADRKEKENSNLKYVNNIQKLEIENKQKVSNYIITFTIFSFFLIIYL